MDNTSTETQQSYNNEHSIHNYFSEKQSHKEGQLVVEGHQTGEIEQGNVSGQREGMAFEGEDREQEAQEDAYYDSLLSTLICVTTGVADLLEPLFHRRAVEQSLTHPLFDLRNEWIELGLTLGPRFRFDRMPS